VSSASIVNVNGDLSADPAGSEIAFGSTSNVPRVKSCEFPTETGRVACGDVDAVKYSALQADGKLHTLAYHRGWQGAELRDEDTGELLCDVQPADSNHSLDGPKLSTTITIQFPLDGERFYRESVVWDLGSPHTPTPLQFATGVAQAFGLSFAQTLELQQSIQDKLRDFVNGNCAYPPPIVLESDTAQSKPPLIVSTLYGEATGDREGGKWQIDFQKPRVGTKSGPPRAPASEKVVSRGKNPAKRKRDCESVREAGLVENVYTDEVLKRLQLGSVSEVKLRWESTEQRMPLGKIASRKDARCHACRRIANCGAFSCGNDAHTFCYDHLTEYFATLQYESMPDPLILDCCPICALSCSCLQCTSVLGMLCAEFKRDSLIQSVSPEHTVFAVFNRSKELVQISDQRNISDQKKKKHFAKRKALKARSSVPKLPISEFPREIFDEVDIDPGTESIYATVYMKDGAFIDPFCVAPVAIASLVACKVNDGVEDGSVDYCNVCNQSGDLLCCDCCPRAFHGACITLDSPRADASDDPWECPSCRKENSGLLTDSIDGTKYRERILAVFDDLGHAYTEDDLQAITTIAILYEMVLELIDYDFGFMFRAPVDTKTIPTYATIVKEPMDLGTIASNITSGKYRDMHCMDGEPVENAVLSILKDVVLVWHNCFTFNLEGSAVYRMAEVQRRRADLILKKSVDSFLSEGVKQQLRNYTETFDGKRLPVVPQHPSHSQVTSLSQSQHKIVATSMGMRGRPVAVFDPDSGRVVKMYATIHTVLRVADLLLNLNYPCEWERTEIDSAGKMRKLIAESSTYPGIRLFGYRWIFFDELEGRKIAVASTDLERKVSGEGNLSTNDAESPEETGMGIYESSPRIEKEAIEMCVDEHSLVFGSVEAALAYGDFTNEDRAMLRSSLHAISSCDSFSELAGRKWRKIRFGKEENGNEAGLGPSSSEIDLSQLPGVVVLKCETISNQTLAGFRSIDAAFEDWLTYFKSSSVTISENRSIDVFRADYLDGRHNVDGVEWRLIQGRESQPTENGSRSSKEHDLKNGSIHQREQPVLIEHI
jgi:hypothetical protein